MICDLPNKIFTTLAFDLTLYFMTNLRRTPGHFFVFLLFTLMCTLTMSMYFRSIAALSKTLAQVRAKSESNASCAWTDKSLLPLGYGSGFRLQSRARYLYRIRDSDKVHATLVPLAELLESRE